jgi:hypothetical protein
LIALDLRLEAFDMDGVKLLAETIARREKLLVVQGESALPSASLNWQIVERYPSSRIMKGHGENRSIDARVVVHASLGRPEAKLTIYEQSVRANLVALLDSAEKKHPWVISPDDLWSSTAVAIAAREAAASGQSVTPEVRHFSKE